jgi:hypothetical protein
MFASARKLGQVAAKFTSGVFATLTGTETLTNKTLTAAVLDGATTVAAAGSIAPAAVVGTPVQHGLYSNNVPKAFASIDQTSGTATLEAGSFNITSVTDGTAGQFIVVWDRDFSITTYVVVGMAEAPTADTTVNVIAAKFNSRAVGSCEFRTMRADTVGGLDSKSFVAAFGAQ